MIKNITIHNFQSHKDTSLDLHEGVNSLTGDSDAGKSAIMRSIIWALSNDLQGDFYVSNWAKNSKGKQTEECSVTIDNVKRYRSPDGNGYEVNGNKFEALRNNVPEQVKKELNIGEVNIQRQLDGPFMLSYTAGENARYINELVNLTFIDEALTWVNGKSRECTSKIKESSERIDRIHLKDENVIKACEDSITHLESIHSTIERIENAIKVNNEKVREISTLKTYDVRPLEESLVKLAELGKDVERKSRMSANERELIEKFSELSRQVIPADLSCKRLSRCNALFNDLSEQSQKVKRQLAEYGEADKEKKSVGEVLPSLEKELATMVCPLCGRKDCKH